MTAQGWIEVAALALVLGAALATETTAGRACAENLAHALSTRHARRITRETGRARRARGLR